MPSKVRKTRRSVTLPKDVRIRVGILDGGKRYSDEQVDPVTAAFAPSLASGAQSVGEVAEQHEFGLGVPQRSWLRGWFDSRSGQVKELAREQFRGLLDGGDPAQAAARVALWAEASIKDRITEEKPFKPLAPETIARRRPPPPYTPLVDTGLLLSSIAADSEVTA